MGYALTALYYALRSRAARSPPRRELGARWLWRIPCQRDGPVEMGTHARTTHTERTDTRTHVYTHSHTGIATERDGDVQSAAHVGDVRRGRGRLTRAANGDQHGPSIRQVRGRKHTITRGCSIRTNAHVRRPTHAVCVHNEPFVFARSDRPSQRSTCSARLPMGFPRLHWTSLC